DLLFETELAGGLGDRLAAADRAGRAVEGGEAAVAEGLHLAPAESVHLPEDGIVMVGQQLAPARVAELARHLSRSHDVRAHHRRPHAIALGDSARAGKELLDLADHGFRVAGPGNVVVPLQLDVAGSRDPGG